MSGPSRSDAVEAHIRAIFGERYGRNKAGQGFVSEVDNLRSQGNSTKKAIRMMVDGGRFLIPTEAKLLFLKSIGECDGRTRNPERIDGIYRSVIERDGTRLYDSIKASRPRAVSESPKVSYNKNVVKATQDHILEQFGDDAYDDERTPEERFVDQIDGLIGGDIRTPQDSVAYWVHGGGLPEIYNVDKAAYLKSIGVDDGKPHDSSESADLYDHIFIREGLKLYNDIVSRKRKPKRPAASSESLKDALSSAGRKVKGNRNGSGKSGKKSTAGNGSRMEVRSIYFDPTESKKCKRPVFDVIIVDSGTLEKVWGKDFNPVTKRAAEYYRDQSESDISGHVVGHVKVKSFMVPVMDSPKPCKRGGSKG